MCVQYTEMVSVTDRAGFPRCRREKAKSSIFAQPFRVFYSTHNRREPLKKRRERLRALCLTFCLPVRRGSSFSLKTHHQYFH